MYRFVRLKTTRFSRAGLARPVKFGLGFLLLGMSGPALGGREAPAVWVPLAPGIEASGGTVGRVDTMLPTVLVPFQDTLHAPQPGQRLVPWTPEYLASPGPGERRFELPGFGLTDSAVQSGLLPRKDRQAGADTRTRQGKVRRRKGSITLSDVVRDVNWRQQTTQRLRTDPKFKAKF